ncbi:hypothetical protein DOTSEDRAFT_67554 [Dothistroma septosporum NZE10]|uniref:Mitochondrial aspartate-glutamate transporter AGC1 n=1 Tax=Dothistroma septosporum (strain NZE10 / CBS 128990) TaxID=675120 RepID=N1Q243_DOTSN|nr:hypothetical protein DOTSEDRAFT_67554 [Dothistroma septosporum NZE10]
MADLKEKVVEKLEIAKEATKESLIGVDLENQASEQSRAEFMLYATKDQETGEYYMSEREFVDAVAPEGEDYHKIEREQYAVLFQVADRSSKNRVSLADWSVFNNLLAKPDAEYEIAFRLFADPSSGLVDFNTFKDVYARNKTSDTVPFNWDSDWAKLYLGGKRHRHSMTYPQFAQMLRGLQGERVRQAFLHFDRNGDGYIEPEDFQRIIVETAAHKLSDHLLSNLPTLCNISPGSRISYANVRAFQNVIREMDLVELLIRKAIDRSSDGKINRVDFLEEASRSTRFSQMTPMEADILFHFASLDQPSGRLGIQDFARVLDASWHAGPDGRDGPLGGVAEVGVKEHTRSGSFLHDVLVSAHHFGLGSLAGAFGAFMVYPIDLVKTRMQNQRKSGAGNVLYKNSIDCFQKIIRNEGFRGLYAGVLPQLVGVAPEKAIKLTVNDLVRGKMTDTKTGQIPFWAEMLAGGSAGGCQVVFTNPLEIVKIRLQVQGEAMRAAAQEGEVLKKRSALWIVRHLGLVGLYKGASACLLRDIPFSAIYFPTYAHLKKDMFGESPTKKLGVLQLLTAGAIAGMPAAYLTTPADVIKTRLQVEARKGDSTYTGLGDCARKVFKEEGFKAFFKGGPARIMRSSPQFGFTLASYEVLQGLLPFPGGAHDLEIRGDKLEPAGGLGSAQASLPHLRCRNALKIINDLDLGFGKMKAPHPEGGMTSWIGGRAREAHSPSVEK